MALSAARNHPLDATGCSIYHRRAAQGERNVVSRFAPFRRPGGSCFIGDIVAGGEVVGLAASACAWADGPSGAPCKYPRARGAGGFAPAANRPPHPPHRSTVSSRRGARPGPSHAERRADRQERKAARSAPPRRGGCRRLALSRSCGVAQAAGAKSRMPAVSSTAEHRRSKSDAGLRSLVTTSAMTPCGVTTRRDTPERPSAAASRQ